MKEIEKHIEVLEDMQHMESMNTSELDSLDYAIHFLKSAKEVEKGERYFIVYYQGLANGSHSIGYMTSKGNTYINIKQATEYIINNSNYTDVVITNIQELSKEDYNEFIK